MKSAMKMKSNSKEINLGKRKQNTPLLGYSSHNSFYAGAKWRKLRAYKLSLDPFCRVCGEEGKLTAANEVDHIIPIIQDETLALDLNNLQSLCSFHHKQKTSQDSRKKPKPRIVNQQYNTG